MIFFCIWFYICLNGSHGNVESHYLFLIHTVKLYPGVWVILSNRFVYRYRDSALPVDMKPLPKEPDADDRKKDHKKKTPKGMGPLVGNVDHVVNKATQCKGHSFTSDNGKCCVSTTSLKESQLSNSYFTFRLIPLWI